MKTARQYNTPQMGETFFVPHTGEHTRPADVQPHQSQPARRKAQRPRHSPGPWIHVWREDLGKFRIGHDSNAMPVASTVNQGNREQEEANARLIAAAPDLLAACQAAMDFLMMGHGDQLNVWDQLNIAVGKASAAKAHGETA